MTRRLSGAAKTARDRRIILDAARREIRRRDPEAPARVVALLVAADGVGR